MIVARTIYVCSVCDEVFDTPDEGEQHIAYMRRSLDEPGARDALDAVVGRTLTVFQAARYPAYPGELVLSGHRSVRVLEVIEGAHGSGLHAWALRVDPPVPRLMADGVVGLSDVVIPEHVTCDTLLLSDACKDYAAAAEHKIAAWESDRP